LGITRQLHAIDKGARVANKGDTLGDDLKSLRTRAEKFEDLMLNSLSRDPRVFENVPTEAPWAEIAQHYREEAAKVRAALIETHVSTGPTTDTATDKKVMV
jgi:hypothetical protein